MRPHLLMRLDPGQRRTHGQGVDQSSGPAGGGVTHGGEGGGGGRPRSLRDWKRVSHHYCHGVTHSGHSAFTHQSVLAQSVCWVTLCLSPHPSISASFILHQCTRAHCLPPPPFTVTYFICLRRQGEFVRLSSSLLSITGRSCRSSHTGPSARGSGMSSFPDSAQFPSYPSVKDTFLWLQRRASKNFAS